VALSLSTRPVAAPRRAHLVLSLLAVGTASRMGLALPIAVPVRARTGNPTTVSCLKTPAWTIAVRIPACAPASQVNGVRRRCRVGWPAPWRCPCPPVCGSPSSPCNMRPSGLPPMVDGVPATATSELTVLNHCWEVRLPPSYSVCDNTQPLQGSAMLASTCTRRLFGSLAASRHRPFDLFDPNDWRNCSIGRWPIRPAAAHPGLWRRTGPCARRCGTVAASQSPSLSTTGTGSTDRVWTMHGRATASEPEDLSPGNAAVLGMGDLLAVVVFRWLDRPGNGRNLWALPTLAGIAGSDPVVSTALGAACRRLFWGSSWSSHYG
jgi:hypothetical protein